MSFSLASVTIYLNGSFIPPSHGVAPLSLVTINTVSSPRNFLIPAEILRTATSITTHDQEDHALKSRIISRNNNFITQANYHRAEIPSPLVGNMSAWLFVDKIRKERRVRGVISNVEKQRIFI